MNLLEQTLNAIANTPSSDVSLEDCMREHLGTGLPGQLTPGVVSVPHIPKPSGIKSIIHSPSSGPMGMGYPHDNMLGGHLGGHNNGMLSIKMGNHLESNCFPWGTPSPAEIAAKKLVQDAQEAKWADEAEKAEGVIGVRHYVREALRFGSLESLYRMYVICLERGMQEEIFEKGKAETFFSAMQGEHAHLALEWLAQKKFSVDFNVIANALEATLANQTTHSLQSKQLNVATVLIKTYKAGLPPHLHHLFKNLEIMDKSLVDLSKAQWEHWELERATSGVRLPSKKEVQRL